MIWYIIIISYVLLSLNPQDVHENVFGVKYILNVSLQHSFVTLFSSYKCLATCALDGGRNERTFSIKCPLLSDCNQIWNAATKLYKAPQFKTLRIIEFCNEDIT
jgi:hypothetical protein